MSTLKTRQEFDVSLQHKSPIVALHCSSASGSQWRSLKAVSSMPHRIFTPDFIGTPSRGAWTEDTFSLADEASEILTLISSIDAPVHLIGHSYGAAVALHIARERPDLVKSLCLYEPTLFSVLRSASVSDFVLYQEIESLVATLQSALSLGDKALACQVFSDFWGGLGTYTAMPEQRQIELQNWIPKVIHDFFALMHEDNPHHILPQDILTTLMVGENTHLQTARIGTLLHGQSSMSRLSMIDNAGHLEPFARRPLVFQEIATHLNLAEDH